MTVGQHNRANTIVVRAYVALGIAVAIGALAGTLVGLYIYYNG